MHTLAYF